MVAIRVWGDVLQVGDGMLIIKHVLGIINELRI